MQVRTSAEMEALNSTPGGEETNATAFNVVEHVKAMFVYTPADLFAPFPPGTAPHIPCFRLSWNIQKILNPEC